jgi:hypothetical protein
MKKRRDHGGVAVRDVLAVPGKELLGGDGVAVGLGHLPAVHQEHVGMQPITGTATTAGPGVLGNFVFVVGELQVVSSAVDVKFLAEVLGAHRRALQVPTGESLSPGTVPAQDMPLVSVHPDGKIGRVALFSLAFQLTALGHQFFDLPTGELSVVSVRFFVVGSNVKVNGAIDLVGQAVVKNGLHHLDLLDDVPRSTGLDAGGEVVKPPHHVVEPVGVLLGDFHGLQFLQAGTFTQLVLPTIGKVANVRNVPDVPHLISLVHQVAIDDVEAREGATIAQVHVTVNGRTTDIKTYVPFHEGGKYFLLAGHAVVKGKFLGHPVEIIWTIKAAKL